jgi:hypothetical protein
MLYIEFGRNRFVGLVAIGKKYTGNGRTDGRTHARTHAHTHANENKSSPLSLGN